MLRNIYFALAMFVMKLLLLFMLNCPQSHASLASEDNSSNKSSFKLPNLDVSQVFSKRNDVASYADITVSTLNRHKSSTPALFLHGSRSLPARITSNVNGIIDALPRASEVLEIRRGRSKADSSKPPVFLIQNEDARGGLITSRLATFLQPTIATNVTIHDAMRQTMAKYFVSSGVDVFDTLSKNTNEVDDWRGQRISEDFSQLPIGSNLTKLNVEPTVWAMIGSGGSALQARYNDYHMTRTVLRGSCRLILIAPENARRLSVFPSIHASQYQSQINLYSPTATEDAPAPYRGEVSEVIVRAGQSIYVPPYWFLHMEELSEDGLTAGVDVLSASLVQTELLQAFMTALPFRGDFDLKHQPTKVIVSMIYLVHLLSRVNGIDSPKKFSRALYKSRFQQLYPETSLLIQKNELKGGFHCYKEDTSQVESILDRLDKIFIANGAQFVANIINKKMISTAVRWLWLGSYVENIARWAMNDPNEAVLFVRECLDQPEKVQVVVEVEGPSSIKLEPK